MLSCNSSLSNPTNAPFGYMTDSRTYALHEYCDVGRERARLFTFFVDSLGFSLLPGRYGGELNNDMLAIGEKDGKTVVLLGLKAVDEDGGIHIDQMSMGPYKQLSGAWLDTVAYSLGLHEETRHFADAINFARDSRTLERTIVFVDPATSMFRTVVVAYEDER